MEVRVTCLQPELVQRIICVLEAHSLRHVPVSTGKFSGQIDGVMVISVRAAQIVLEMAKNG